MKVVRAKASRRLDEKGLHYEIAQRWIRSRLGLKSLSGWEAELMSSALQLGAEAICEPTTRLGGGLTLGTAAGG